MIDQIIDFLIIVDVGIILGLVLPPRIIGKKWHEKKGPKKMKKEPKWLYRLEATTPGHGLWYDGDGNYVWDLGDLPECKTKDLPMGYDERYKKDGRDWFSSCTNQEDLTHWFSYEDAMKLADRGFVATKYFATEYEEYEMETTFIKDTALERVEISLSEFFKK